MKAAIFAPCAIIPTHNHAQNLPHILSVLRALGLATIIVDDGSSLTFANLINELTKGATDIHLIRLDKNMGKGVAVVAGFRHAIDAGYTHAIQIDADGQHEVEKCAEFLARARARPNAVICGAAKYDESVPRGRKYGRYVTHFFVWIETFSFAVTDSMCGFRLYPLLAVKRLLESYTPGARMEFDTEVLVHLVWNGTEVEMLPVEVRYPANNISNFRLWHDNLRISWMHTRLLAQAPWRLLVRALKT